LCGYVVDDFFRLTGDCDTKNTEQVGFTPARSQTLTRKRGEGKYETGEYCRIHCEDVQIEVEWLTGLDGAAVEMAGAEDERARRIVEAARPFAKRNGREYFRVGAGLSGFAGLFVTTLGNAGYAAENGAERASQNVGGFARREENRFARYKLKAQREKIESHTALLYRKHRTPHGGDGHATHEGKRHV
jgi:hypothetical protein